jgi:ParB-like chromosome segregation protein Spo0J
MEQNIVMMNPKELKMYKFNNKIHTKEQVGLIKQSIQDHGFRSPVLVDENLEILAGHGRTKASLEMKLDSIPVIIVTGLSEEQKREYRLLDNRLSDLGKRDMENIKVELEAIDDPALDFMFDFALTDTEVSKEDEKKIVDKDYFHADDEADLNTNKVIQLLYNGKDYADIM